MSLVSVRCGGCRHFRLERDPSELLGLPFTLGTSDAVSRNRDGVRQAHTSECRQKRALMEMNHTAWPRRPQVLAYCGLRETDDVYLIHEMKDRGGLCRDFRPADGREARPEREQPEPPRDRPSQEPSMRTCETCRHNVPQRGPQRDHVNVMDFIDPSTNFYNDGMHEGPGSTSRAGTITGSIDRLLSMADNRKSLEMKLALQSDGTLPQVPEYFAHCAKYSEPGRYVLCKIKNPAGQCPGWSGAEAGSGRGWGQGWGSGGPGGSGSGPGGGYPSGW